MTNDFSLMIHGGAGELSNVDASERRADYLDSMRITLEYGRAILEQGGAALEAVEICTSLLEDDPLFNAGIGSVLNEDGKVEMDAAIMCGATLAAGAVAGVRNIANPIQLARMVLAESVHVMLIGEGAMRFADSEGVKTVPDDYCITPERRTQWEEACRAQRGGLDHDSLAHQQKREGDKLGTVGAVARDCEGRLAAAVSTGGTVNKRVGRVGDSPVIGAGVYADDETCAVSCTGFGEDFIRTVLAKTLSDIMLFRNKNADEAAEAGIAYFMRRVKGRGGFIIVDKAGNCASAFTTRKMIHGWIEKGGEAVCRL